MKPYFENQETWNIFQNELLDWMGTPYHHLWNYKGRGADCTLYVGSVLLNIGVFTKLDYGEYPRDWHVHENPSLVTESWLANACNVPENLKMDIIENCPDVYMQGDIFLLSLVPSGVIHHCGVCIDNNTMIHCMNPRGVHKSPFRGWWKRHVKKTIRIMEIMK